MQNNEIVDEDSFSVREKWSTRLGFYFAAIGSAFGLGNLWRFPYIVAENGGGAFVLLYVFLAFFAGTSLLIAELIVGKKTQQGLVGAYSYYIKKKKSWRWAGTAAMGTCLMVLAYYAIVSGWVIFIISQFLASSSLEGFNPSEAMSTLRESPWLQFFLAIVHLAVTMLIVSKGLKNGLEKWLRYLMSLFTVLLVVLVVKSLSLEKSTEALRFLFYPDFSKLGWRSLGDAVGHMLFTLSLGLGVMLTYGSYLKHDAYVPENSFRVTIFDTGISFISGLLVFPILFSANFVGAEQNILFEGMPILLESLIGGNAFGIAFFLCLYLAALSASIGLMEVVTSYFSEKFRISRRRSCLVVCVLAVAMMFGFAALSFLLSIDRADILVGVDALIINWILPILALVFCIFVGFYVSKEDKKSEFQLTTKPSYSQLYWHWNAVVRWLAPAIIVLGLLFQIVGLLKN